MANNFVPAVTFENDKMFITIRKEVDPTVETSDYLEIDWVCVCKALHYLIEQRVRHCEQQLALAVINSDVIKPHAESEFIGYRNGGHFSIPVYRTMSEFLSKYSCPDDVAAAFSLRTSRFPECPSTDVQPDARLLTQQALRQLFFIVDGKRTFAQEQYNTLNTLYFIPDLVTILTDHLLMI